MRRFEQAGAKTGHLDSGDARVAARLAKRDTYDAVMDVGKHHAGAYGMGVEYAHTMVRGAPPTVHPGWEFRQSWFTASKPRQRAGGSTGPYLSTKPHVRRRPREISEFFITVRLPPNAKPYFAEATAIECGKIA